MKKLILILLISLLCFSWGAEAKYRRTATVKYQKQYGWSKLYTVEVNFMSGHELNIATKTISYDAISVYAIIFWSQDQVTIIKLKTFLACGFEVTKECIDDFMMDLQGFDQDGDKWNICLIDTCF